MIDPRAREDLHFPKTNSNGIGGYFICDMVEFVFKFKMVSHGLFGRLLISTVIRMLLGSQVEAALEMLIDDASAPVEG